MNTGTDYIGVREAAEQARVTEATIINWCEQRYGGLGIKVGGRWRIFPSVLKKVLNGTLEESRREGGSKCSAERQA